MAGNNPLEERLRAGIEAARRGDKVAAVRLLRQVVDHDVNNEVAWMWLASALDNLQERRQALEQALRINPGNQRAQQAMDQLNAVLGTPATARKPRPQPVARTGSRIPGIVTTVAAAVLVLAIIVLVIFFIVNSSQQQALPNLATQQAALNTEAPTPTIDPDTYTATPFYGVIVTPDPNKIPTLPPTFTPTFTPTPLVLTATPTSYPMTQFSLVYTSINAGETRPSLFRMLGDGTGDQQLAAGAAGFSDVAYSPDGQKIAFVRTATFTNDDGQEVTSPELFIAAIDNPGAARQITRLGGSVLGRPSWAPDAVRLVISSNYDGDEDLWILTDDGNNLQKITNNDFADRDPAWAPSGEVILYASEQESGPSSGLTELFTIDSDGQNITQLTNADRSSYSPAWSPDGQYIVFASDRNGDGDIFIMEASGQNFRLITGDDGGAEDRRPAFNPVSQSIVFLSNRAGYEFQFYVSDLRGSNIGRLADPGRDIESFAFKPEPFLQPR